MTRRDRMLVYAAALGVACGLSFGAGPVTVVSGDASSIVTVTRPDGEVETIDLSADERPAIVAVSQQTTETIAAAELGGLVYQDGAYYKQQWPLCETSPGTWEDCGAPPYLVPASESEVESAIRWAAWQPDNLGWGSDTSTVMIDLDHVSAAEIAAGPVDLALDYAVARGAYIVTW